MAPSPRTAATRGWRRATSTTPSRIRSSGMPSHRRTSSTSGQGPSGTVALRPVVVNRNPARRGRAHVRTDAAIIPTHVAVAVAARLSEPGARAVQVAAGPTARTKGTSIAEEYLRNTASAHAAPTRQDQSKDFRQTLDQVARAIAQAISVNEGASNVAKLLRKTTEALSAKTSAAKSPAPVRDAPVIRPLVRVFAVQATAIVADSM